jgi:hypothetical protein
MDYFYIIVSAILITLLILILTYIGIVMQRSKKENQSYPPEPPSNCPDYWTISPDRSCIVPASGSKNTGKLYNNNNIILTNSVGKTGYTAGYSNDQGTPTINFTDAGWTAGGSSALCNEQVWANTYNIMWDGVSNYNGCKA